MRRALFFALPAAVALVVAALAGATPLRANGGSETYVVLYDANASLESARDAVRAAGGQVLRENLRVGVATVTSSNPDFVTDVAATQAVEGAARNAPIGNAVPALRPKLSPEDLDTLRNAARGTQRSDKGRHKPKKDRSEPLADLQWGMKLIHATTDGSYDEQRGDKRVLVGILDTGVDGNHPDIAPNFSRKLSRNFTTDIPLVDGPCEEEPDASCSDPADVDENSHGTHVASIVASPINKLGVAGVAPDVTIVNLRAGQDSGFFFLQASLDALTYAGDNGIDVVNMSYFIDPWLYNCTANPADTPEQQLEQRTIIAATQRALDYAHAHGVTLVGAAGNEDTDLGDATKADGQSPNFPPGTNHPRTVDNTCLDLPTEGNNVLSISSIGPTKRKADYSNYGVEQITVAAPGGFFRDDPWNLAMTPAEREAAGIPNLILAAYPENVAREAGDLNPDGTPNTPFVVRDCRKDTCAYYQYIQGTSMASPHAAGVAALIVSEHGKRRHGDTTLDPATTQRILEQTATDQACPEPRLHSYADKGRGTSFDALCVGTPEFNGFYGHGIIDALAAVEDDKH